MTAVDDQLVLWGSVCGACGTVTPSSMVCATCMTNGDTEALWRRLDEMADLDGLAADSDEPIHEWFNLTYANYLVLPRTILQSMPVAWQRRFVKCLRQLQAAAWDLPQADRYTGNCRDERGRFVADPVPHYQRGRTRVPLRDIR
jgi:hypothetical protein